MVNRKATVYAESGNTVRMRKEPNDQSEVVQKVIIGTEVGVLGGDNFWKEIVLPTGQSGWMMASFVREDGQETDSGAATEETVAIPKKTIETLYNAITEVMKYVGK